MKKLIEIEFEIDGELPEGQSVDDLLNQWLQTSHGGIITDDWAFLINSWEIK